MKRPLTYFAALLAVLLLNNCKKDTPATNEPDNSPNLTELSLATASVESIGVQTLYGSPYAAGALVDGNGSSARFNTPRGLYLMPDGTIYIADTYNNAIRRISTTGYVSTVPIKPNDYGGELTKPTYIGVEHNTGTFHFVTDGFDGDAYDAGWIAKSNGDFVQLYFTTYVNATALTRDPYTDIFYWSRGDGIIQHIPNIEGIYGPAILYDKKKIGFDVDRRGFSWDALAIGYNKVVYFAKNGNIFKYTPGGVTAAISNGYPLSRITCMILNKDSRTMYVADNGYIKRIDGKKVTVLAGPKGTNDGRDGAAKDADVYAFGLALAKGENTLYFTDMKSNTVRKIYLKPSISAGVN